MEMHLIAYYYHWSRSEVWELPVLERRMWSEVIQEQIKAENNAVNKGDNSKQLSEYKESKDYY